MQAVVTERAQLRELAFNAVTCSINFLIHRGNIIFQNGSSWKVEVCDH